MLKMCLKPIGLAKHGLFGVWLYFVILQLWMWNYQLNHRLLQWSVENKKLSANNVPTVKKSRRLQFDVISIGSNSRSDYIDAQRRTWASDLLVRNFYHVTEEDNPEQTCAERLTRIDVLQISKKCRNIHILGEKDPNFSYYMQRMARSFAPRAWMMKKANPVGWLCAQKRFGFGLVKTLRRYEKNELQQQQLPSYLLMVDDDTYFNMKLLAEYLEEADDQRRRSPQDPYVAAGCRIMINRGKSAKIFPWGGFGVLFSQESLARLQKPIHCNFSQEESSKFANSTVPELSYVKQVCMAIRKNLIREVSLFRDGMSLIDLMEAYTLAEPFEKYKDWNTGFCLHSDHFLGYFIEHYPLSQLDGLQAIQNSEFLTGAPATEYIGNCKNLGDNCNATSSLVCHNQSPEDMENLFTNNT